jgi:hypothetical protein
MWCLIKTDNKNLFTIIRQLLADKAINLLFVSLIKNITK